jgi:NTE family protein
MTMMCGSVLSATAAVPRQTIARETARTVTPANIRNVSGREEEKAGGSIAAKPAPPGPIASVLGALPRLKRIVESLDSVALADLEASLEWYGVRGGTVLFRQAEPAHDAFVLVAGRLGVFLDAGTGMRLIAQIGPGELVGEMALISAEPRSATVVALRDSELVRIPRAAADRLMTSSPQLMLYVIRLLANRLQGWHRPPLQQATRTIAIVPLDDQVLDPGVGTGLYREFSSLSPHVGLLDNGCSAWTTEALARIEQRHDLVLYVADRRSSPWSNRCLRQADRVVFVANAEFAPDAEANRQIDDVGRLHRPADLMLVNRADAVEPQGATQWLGRFSPDRIVHVRRGNAADYARMARLTTGRAVGLVLSGGGARGFAHVGAIRALEKAGIPIDLIGGTSIGAIVGCAAALGLDSAGIEQRVRHGFIENKPLSDYTLPLVSLARGRRMSRLMREHCGTSTIENMWRNFFCVSSNLSSGKMVVHQQGLAWQALRASTSIPGIVPPFIDQGQVLVDGGIMNNFPSDVMSSLARGRIVGVDVAAGTAFLSETDNLEDKSLLWMLRNRRAAFPGIVSLLVRSGTVNSDTQHVASRSQVDVLVQPQLDGIDRFSFDSLDAAIEDGYRATMEAIERLETPLV